MFRDQGPGGPNGDPVVDDPAGLTLNMLQLDDRPSGIDLVTNASHHIAGTSISATTQGMERGRHRLHWSGADVYLSDDVDRKVDLLAPHGNVRCDRDSWRNTSMPATSAFPIQSTRHALAVLPWSSSLNGIFGCAASHPTNPGSARGLSSRSTIDMTGCCMFGTPETPRPSNERTSSSGLGRTGVTGEGSGAV